MQTTLGILTALVLAVSAFLGYSNWGAYKEKIADRQKEENTRDNTLRPKLKSTLEERDETKTLKEEQIELAKAKGEEVEAQQAKIDALKKDIAAKEAQVAEQKVALDALTEQLKETGDLKELAGKIERMNAELVELQSSIDVSTSKLNNMIAEKTRTAAIVKSYEEENEWRNANVSNPKLTTRISSIFDTYGFVTLPVGNNAGVVGGSTLEVVRDGSVVATLLVKTVEAGTAAAEIVPGSVQADTVLMVGDEIRAAQAKKAAPKPAATVAPAPVGAGAAPAEGAEPAAEEAAPADAAAEEAAPAAEADAAPAAEADPFQ
jgi:uncharacterized coiled-coil protein SlyX